MVNCRKLPIDSQGLESRLSEIGRVLVTKGKKVLEFDPERDKDEVLKTAIGRSGNLRAPSIQHEGLLIVGFHEEAYAALL